MNPVIKTQDIVSVFRRYHQQGGYTVLDSQPFVSEDPTVMFVNATITPFKSWFTDPSIVPTNFALVQKCFRMGSITGLDTIGTNPFYFTFFEMCGSGTFHVNHSEAVGYLLDMLESLGLEKSHLAFTIPDDEQFRRAFAENSIDPSSYFTLKKNGHYWQAWKFGKMGPVGKGLTAIYCRTRPASSVDDMVVNPDQFVELLNLIHIYGQENESGIVVPAAHQGFDLGMGLERIAAALQNTDSYGTDSIKPLTNVVSEFANRHGFKIADGAARALTDHLRAIIFLLNEGVIPLNKKHGYVLRRLIRRLLELVWIASGRIIPVSDLIADFRKKLEDCGNRINIQTKTIQQSVSEESLALQAVLQNATCVIKRRPDTSVDVLRDTYGLPPSLLVFVKKRRTE